jgi:hypothetical protein
MENTKKFFFSKEENVLDLLSKLDRKEMNSIVGSYSEGWKPTYSEGTKTYKPKPLKPKLESSLPTLITDDGLQL